MGCNSAIDVLISVDALDIRNESGMSLPVIKSGDEGYGADNGIGYKYVLTVTETGKQSVYLETILEQKNRKYRRGDHRIRMLQATYQNRHLPVRGEPMDIVP